MRDVSSIQQPGHPLIPSEMNTPAYKQLLLQCVHCGLCLESCPTYVLFGTEYDSPRGRIELMHAASEGRLDRHTFLTIFREHINLCLDCRACETVCPSGVKYGKLVEGARIAVEDVAIEENQKPGLAESQIRRFGLEKLMPQPKRFKNFARLLRLYQRCGLQAAVRKVNLLPWQLQGMAELLPAVTDSRMTPGMVYPAAGEKRGTVAFFSGCVQEAFLGRINAATVRVLQRNGFEVHIPEQQTCCGAAQWHTGDKNLAVKLARQNIDTFLDGDYDAVINNAGGCGLTLQEYPNLLHADPVYAEKSRQFSAKMIDFSKFIFEHMIEPPAARMAVRAVYSDSCHLRHGQKVVDPPRSLLKSIPGLELIEIKHPDMCCGSAGIYNITNPEPASAILNSKMAEIAATGAGLIVTSNTGCHMQLAMGARKAGLPAHVMHIAEVLDYAYRAETRWLASPPKPARPLKGPRKPPASWLEWQAQRHQRLTRIRRHKNDPVDSKFAALQEQLTPGQILEDPALLLTYERDAANERAMPDGLVFACSTEDVQKTLRWCAETGTPVVARGAGSGLAGNSIAEQGGLILEFSQMKKMLDIDLDSHSVTVQPGMITMALDEMMKPYGFTYPPDPASGKVTTLGGNVSCNSGGPHCFKYGVTGNYVMGLEVVLADGRVVQLGGKTLDAPGYDLAGLMTGSEGMLGVITTATLGVRKRPPAAKTLLAAFDSLEQAGEAVSAIIGRGLIPATLEFMDRRMMHAVEQFAAVGLPLEASAVLILETDGFPQSVGPQMDEIIEVLKECGVHTMRIAQTEAEREKLWYARKSSAGAIANLALAEYTTDVTVPRSKMAPTLIQINRILDEAGLTACIVAHAGDGNLHPMILVKDPKDPELIRHIHQTARKICEYCVQIGGSITGEHGVGTEKREFMPLQFSPVELAAMQEIKEVFDPAELLNPGKVFPKSTAPETQPEKSISVRTEEVSLSPSSTDEAAQTIRLLSAQAKRIRISSAAPGTGSQDGQRAILSTTNLSQMLSCRPEDLYAHVGAGMRLEDLQQTLKHERMWLPIQSPWADASLGGLAGSNLNAPLRMRYGSLRDLVLAMTVVLADGRTLCLGRPVVKNVAGFDLLKLFTGSCGTLGLITDLTLKITTLPHLRITRALPVERLADGLEWGKAICRENLIGSAVLLAHGVAVDGVETPSSLVYTLEGYPQDVHAAGQVIQEKLNGAPQPVTLAISGTDLWAGWLGGFTPQNVYRTGIPAGKTTEVLASAGTHLDNAAWIADVYNGLIYTSGMDSTPALAASAQKLGGYTVRMDSGSGAQNTNGTLSQPANLDLMKAIKDKWDPHGLFEEV